jgi:hypothetical protein
MAWSARKRPRLKFSPSQMALIRQHPGVNVHPSCIPVIRRPRSEWRIPRPVDSSHLLQKRAEEAQLKTLAAGTTAEGREILRKNFTWRKSLSRAKPKRRPKSSTR